MSVKKKLTGAVTGAVATAVLPAGYGVVDWRVLAGAAALGAVGGFFGVDVAGRIRKRVSGTPR